MAERQPKHQRNPRIEAFELLPIQPRTARYSPPHHSRILGHQLITEQNLQLDEPVLPRMPSFVTRPPVRTNSLRRTTQPRFYTHRPYRPRMLPSIPRPTFRNGGRGLTPRPRLQPQYAVDRSKLLPRQPSNGSGRQRLRQSRPQGNRVGPPAYESPPPSPSQFRRPQELKKILPEPSVFETKAQPKLKTRNGQQKLPQTRPITQARIKLLPPPSGGKSKGDKALTTSPAKIEFSHLDQPEPKLLEDPISLWSINNIEYISYGEKVGSGTFSNVFIIRRKVDEQLLAAKCSKMTARSRAYIRREYAILSRLNHPNIVKALDFIEYKNVSMMVMEYFTCGTILPIADVGPRIPEQVAQIYVRQCYQVLAYIHSCGVLHNDIKPENILLDFEEFCPHGRTVECNRLKCAESLYKIKLIDFGLAALLPAGKDIIRGSAGTVLYMSPETKYDYTMSPKTDVWSMGMTTYQMLAGRLPYEKNTSIPPLEQLLAQNSTYLNIPELQPLSDNCRHFLSHVLDINFEKRYTAAEAVDHPWLNPQTTTPPIILYFKRILEKALWLCRFSDGICECCTRKGRELKEYIQTRYRDITRQQILDRRAAEELGLLSPKQPVTITVVEQYIPYHDKQILKPGHRPHTSLSHSRGSNSPNLEVAAEYLERRGIVLDGSEDQALPGPLHEPELWVKVEKNGLRRVTGLSTTVQVVRSDKIVEPQYEWLADQTEYEPQPSTSVESWKFINGNDYEPLAGPSNAPQRWRFATCTKNNSDRREPRPSIPQTPKAERMFQRLLEDFEKADSNFEIMSSIEFHDWLREMGKLSVHLPEWMKINDEAIDVTKPLGRQSGNTPREHRASTRRVQHPQIQDTNLQPMQKDPGKPPDINLRPRLPTPTQTPTHTPRRRMLPTVPDNLSSRRESRQSGRMENIRQDEHDPELPRRPNTLAYILQFHNLNLQSSDEDDEDIQPVDYSPQ